VHTEYNLKLIYLTNAFSALTLLVGQQESHSARCRYAYGPADATATHCLLVQQIQIGFTVLVPAHPGCAGQRANKRVSYLTSYLLLTPF